MAYFKSFEVDLFVITFLKKQSFKYLCKCPRGLVNSPWESKHLVRVGGNRGWNVGWFWKACRDNSNDPERKALFIAEGSGKAVSPFPWLDKGTGPPFQSSNAFKTDFLIQCLFYPPCTAKNPLTSFLPMRGGLVSGSRIDGAAATATARTTEVAKEGVDSFLDKREPEWPE